ncbi:MAG: hypothetical protein EHM53_12285 [Methanoregulaceae archaeon]|nr:MAG: hypothetical protein EHM53_12285 [Methanoregulaceae archaeon]
MMTVRTRVFLIVFCIAVLTLLSAACISTTFGEVAYSTGEITLPVSHDGSDSEGYIQVTVYRIANNQQEETGTFFAPLNLQRGANMAIIPAQLEPGQYKLYFYLIQNGERKAATIRDLTVN